MSFAFWGFVAAVIWIGAHSKNRDEQLLWLKNLGAAAAAIQGCARLTMR